MKLVINRCYGGFSLSKEQALALGVPEDELYEGIGGTITYYGGNDIDRNDPKLIEVVEMNLPSAWASDLQVVEIPDNAFYKIEEYDGWEHIVWSESEIHYA